MFNSEAPPNAELVCESIELAVRGGSLSLTRRPLAKEIVLYNFEGRQILPHKNFNTAMAATMMTPVFDRRINAGNWHEVAEERKAALLRTHERTAQHNLDREAGRERANEAAAIAERERIASLRRG